MKYSRVGRKIHSKQKRVKQSLIFRQPLRALVNTDNEIPGIPDLVIKIANSLDLIYNIFHQKFLKISILLDTRKKNEIHFVNNLRL